jgi:uncharacterized membrane protein
MSKMLVVVFDDEKKAYEGSKALTELHWDGSISLYAAAVVARDASGEVSTKDEMSEGPIGLAIGMMTGTLVGMLGGPQGMVMGAVAGGAMGSIGDVINLGVGIDFLDEVTAQIEPGSVALIAEVEETWVTPVDSRMEALGGTVYRKYRVDVEDEQIASDNAAARQEWNDLKDEFKTANEENKAKLHEKMEASKAKLKDASERTKAKMDAIEKERDEKIAAIKKQVGDARAENKEKLDNRVEQIKVDFAARGSKLKESWEHTKQSFAH